MIIGKRHALLWGPLFIFIVAFVLHVNQMFVMFAALSLLAPVSYMLGRRKLEGVTAARHGRSVMTAGEQGAVTLTIRNDGRLRQFFLAVRDALPDGLESPEGGEALIADLPAGSEEQIEYTLLARRRGVYQVGPLTLEGSDYLGMYKFTRRLGKPAELLVYPQVIPVPNLWRPSLRGRAPQRSRRRLVGQGGEFFGIRDYSPGDDLRRVDWKTSARRAKLAVVETEQVETMEAVILLDLSAEAHAGEGDASTIEYAATLAASLASEALERGCSVGLIAAGAQDNSVPISPGPRRQLHILEALARVQPDGTRGLVSALAEHERSLPPACGVAVISPDISPGLIATLARLTALGHPVTWFALARHSFDEELSTERHAFEKTAAQAAAHGASVVRIYGDAPLAASLLRRGGRGRRG